MHFILLALVLMFPMVPTLAQELLTEDEPTTPTITLATVNIHDVVTTVDGTTAQISFTLANRDGVQPGVQYSVVLMENAANGQVVADEYISDDILSLGEGSSFPLSLTYTAPETLSGSYSLYLKAQNAEGFPFAFVPAGEMTLSGTPKTSAVIDISSCYLTILGEENSPHYGQTDGVDIDTHEVLESNCLVTNTGTGSLLLTPTFTTKAGSSYGETIPAEGGDITPVPLSPNESREVVTQLPKGGTPDTYHVTLAYSDSNSVSYTYTLRGAGATIENIVLDKPLYQEGETANVSFVWSPSADMVSNVREGTGTALGGASVQIDLMSGGVSCGTATSPLTTDSPLIEIPVSVTGNCADPEVKVTITDSAFGLLAESTFTLTPTSMTSTLGDTITKAIGYIPPLWISLVGLLLGLALIIYTRHRHNVTMMTPPAGPLVFMLLMGAALMFPGGARADTFYVGTTPGDGASYYYVTASLDKSAYVAGETMSVSGSAYEYNGGTELITVSYRLDGGSGIQLYSGSGGTFNRSFAVPAGYGDHRVRVEGNFPGGFYGRADLDFFVDDPANPRTVTTTCYAVVGGGYQHDDWVGDYGMITVTGSIKNIYKPGETISLSGTITGAVMDGYGYEYPHVNYSMDSGAWNRIWTPPGGYMGDNANFSANITVPNSPGVHQIKLGAYGDAYNCNGGLFFTVLPPVVACGDGIDNDGDGLIDFGSDTGCLSASDPDERDTACTWVAYTDAPLQDWLEIRNCSGFQRAYDACTAPNSQCGFNGGYFGTPSCPNSAVVGGSATGYVGGYQCYVNSSKDTNPFSGSESGMCYARALSVQCTNANPPTAAPANLSAVTGSQCGSGIVTVSWNSIAGMNYDLEINGTLRTMGSATSYADSGLSAGQSRTYRVRAVNGDGTSPWSTLVSGTAPAACLFPDLVPSGFGVSAAPYVQGTPLTITGTVSNTGAASTQVGFTDGFRYQWGGTNGVWNTFAGNEVVNSALGAGGVKSDVVTFTPLQTGILYIQYCVDITNAVNEGGNESNCRTSGALTVNATIPVPPLPQCRDGVDNDGDGKVDHPADPGCLSPDDTDETDVPPTGFSCQGSVPPNATAYGVDESEGLPSDALNWTHVSVDTAAKCEFGCDNGYAWVGNSCVVGGSDDDDDTDPPGDGDGDDTDPPGDGTGTLPDITASPTFVNIGETVTVSWDTNNGNEALCTITGPGMSGSVPGGSGTAETGSVAVVIQARTTFTLSCGPGLIDSVTVDVRPDTDEG